MARGPLRDLDEAIQRYNDVIRPWWGGPSWSALTTTIQSYNTHFSSMDDLARNFKNILPNFELTNFIKQQREIVELQNLIDQERKVSKAIYELSSTHFLNSLSHCISLVN